MTNTPIQPVQNVPSRLIAAQNEMSRQANLSRKLEITRRIDAVMAPKNRKVICVLRGR